MNVSRRGFLGAAMMAAGGCAMRGAAPAGGCRRWYKGMLHCHSYWSDGRAFPEHAVSAYKKLGYDFMSLTDHNRLSMTRDEWRPVCAEEGGWPPKVIPRYLDSARRQFPWIRTRKTSDGGEEVRLTPYSELLHQFNEPGRFLLMPGVEVTRGTGNPTDGRQVHMNYINLDEVIPSAKRARLVQDTFTDHTAATLIHSTYDEAELLAKAKGNPPHLVTLNHPHWPYYDVLPQDLIDNPEIRFFEVVNGGAETDAPAEFWRFDGNDNDRFWDVVNAFRVRAGQPLLYGTAVDDAHWYPFSGATTPETCQSAYVGNGWIRVRADALCPESIFSAMERGDFYASNGLELEDVSFDGRTLRVSVPSVAGVTCRVKFIVTKRDFSDRIVQTVTVPKTAEMKFPRKIPVHSDEIGQVAKEISGRRGEAFAAAYTLADDDLYVRARIESDKPSPWATWHRSLSPHPVCRRFANAWTQPYTIK